MMMRAVVLVAVLLVTVDAISFQDLVDRAEEADHPKPKVVQKKLAPTLEELGQRDEMNSWSTEHLLGLDQPAPADLFADLQKESKPLKLHSVEADEPKKVVKKVKKVAKKVVKVAKKAPSPEDIVPEEEEDEVSPTSLLHPTKHVAAPPTMYSVHASLPRARMDAKPKEYHSSVKPHLTSPLSMLKKHAEKKHVAPLSPDLREDEEEENDEPVSVGSYVSSLMNHVEKKPAVKKAHQVQKKVKKTVANLIEAADAKPKPKPAKDMLRGLSRSMLVDEDNTAKAKAKAARAKAKEQAGVEAEQAKIQALADEDAGSKLPELDLDAGEDDDESEDDESSSKKDIPKLGDFLDVDSGSDDDDFA